MSLTPVTILDAGMGKTLSQRGVEIPASIWSANALLVAPQVIVDIHLENIAAGARVITTNSYGVIRNDLAKIGIEDRATELNQLAGKLAQQARDKAGIKGVLIAGSLPPLNGSYRPDLVLKQESLLPLYREQVAALCPYVDLFICETMSHSAEAMAAADAASGSGKPVFVAFTLHDEQSTCLKSGESLATVCELLQVYKPAGILANCSLPERISEAMPVLVKSGADVVGGYANAFSEIPKDWLLDGDKATDGRLTIREGITPERYADFAERWIKQGANLVGGCCGTTAVFIQAISERITSLQVRQERRKGKWM
jgi:S-methylmethionine-dependent homocysteine/selenocysteine methylase